MFDNRPVRPSLDRDDRYCHHYRVSCSCVHDRHRCSCRRDDVSTDVEAFGSWISIDSICIDRCTIRHRVRSAVATAAVVGSDDHDHDHGHGHGRDHDTVVLSGYFVSLCFPWYDGDYCWGHRDPCYCHSRTCCASTDDYGLE